MRPQRLRLRPLRITGGLQQGLVERPLDYRGEQAVAGEHLALPQLAQQIPLGLARDLDGSQLHQLRAPDRNLGIDPAEP